MNEVLIRRAELSDAPAIARIAKESLGYGYPPEKAEKQLALLSGRESDRIWVAEIGERTVGFLHAAEYRSVYFDPMKNILALAVLEESRGRGAGRLLLAKAEEWASQEGAAGVRLTSGMARKGAHAFYLACGYTNTKESKNFEKLL